MRSSEDQMTILDELLVSLIQIYDKFQYALTKCGQSNIRVGLY